MLVQTSKPKYIFFCDPGHAWLRVKRSELIALNIQHRITPFSYERGAWVYLEEDLDAYIFLQAKYGDNVYSRELVELGIIKDKFSNNPSSIRDYDHYQA